MKVKTVTFGKTFNDGNFCSTRIDFSAEVDPDDDEIEVLKDLIDLTYEARDISIKEAKKNKEN